MAEDEAQEVVTGDGYAVGNIAALGHGEFGDGSVHRLGPGGIARIDPATVRRIRNVGEGDLVHLAVGGKDGYVESDGHLLASEET